MKPFAAALKHGNRLTLIDLASGRPLAATDRFRGLLMSRLDFDIRVLKLPSIPRSAVEGFLRYRSRSLYPGNPEETAFAYSLVGSRGARFAVLFLCPRSTVESYRKLAAGSPLYLPFHFYRPFLDRRSPRATVLTSWLGDCVDLLLWDSEAGFRAAAIRRGASFEEDWAKVSSGIPSHLGKPRWVALCGDRDREAIQGTLAPAGSGSVRIVRYADIRLRPSRRQSLFALPRDPRGIVPRVSLPVLGLLVLVLASLVVKKGVDREASYARALQKALVERERTNARLTELQNEIETMGTSLAQLRGRQPVQPYEVLSELASLLGADTSIRSFVLENGSFQLEAVGSNPLDKMEQFRSGGRFANVRLLQIVPLKDSQQELFRMTGKILAQ